MIVLSGLLILAATIAAAFVADSGLTGAMRRLALCLLVSARRIDQRHAARQKDWREGIAAEGGAL